MSGRRALLLVATVTAACGSKTSTLTLQITLSPADLPVATLEVEVRQAGRSIAERTFPWRSDGHVGVFLPASVSGEVDVLARGRDSAGRTVAEGQGRATVAAGQASAPFALVLERPAPPVPDASVPDAGPPADASLPDAAPPDGRDAELPDATAPDLPGEPPPSPPPVDSPRPVRPFNAEPTGSVHAAAALRPRFGWTTVPGAASYQIQVDDSCALAAAGCAFPSPEVDATTADVTFVPGAPLAVSTTAPVGRRYAWRVRACNASGCGPWSAVRVVDVGRQLRDYDGDGYADALVASNTTGVALLFRGGPLLDAKPDLEIRSDASGFEVASVGDTNGDGYPDLVIGANDDVGLYLGGPALHTTPDVVLTRPAPGPLDDFFGASVAGAGDVDGDGFADVVVSAISQPGGKPASAYLYRGGSKLDPRPAAVLTLGHDDDDFGAGLASGDVNGDGFSDVVVGALHTGTSLFFGGSAFDTKPDVLYAAFPARDGLTAVDLNGDGFSEVVIAARDGTTVVLPGGPHPEDKRIPLAMPGDSVGAGDVNGDGFGDVVVGKSFEAAYVYLGGASWSTAPVTILMPQVTRESFGGRVSIVGDMNGDGAGELLVAASNPGMSSDTTGSVYVFLGGAALASKPVLTLHGTRPTDFFGDSLALLGASARPRGPRW